jgi:hypothetical protein
LLAIAGGAFVMVEFRTAETLRHKWGEIAHSIENDETSMPQARADLVLAFAL